MKRKTGSQVFGVDVQIVNGTITKRDAQHVLERVLGITDRQARAAVASYRAEGWCEPPTAINAPLAVVSSFEQRLAAHALRRAQASAGNGHHGGRPRKR